jgi:hypothetical protein
MMVSKDSGMDVSAKEDSKQHCWKATQDGIIIWQWLIVSTFGKILYATMKTADK